MRDTALLSVENLRTSFKTENGKITAVDDVSFQLREGKTLAIVGESGCGKSVTALSIMRLLPEANSMIDGGKIIFKGEDILSYTQSAMQHLRGNEISMIFQEPMTALNPVFTIGSQIIEVFRIHRGLTKKAAHEAAVEMLKEVSISAPEQRMKEYPFQMSGGMRQRIMIAMALACEPKILIADEPTTALDVTIQAQILKLMKTLQRDHGTSVLFITHDLGVVADVADEIVIMYAGKVAESGSVFDLFEKPSHPYTVGLMAAIPRLDDDKDSGLLSTIEGTVPSLHNLPNGCRFNTRCPKVEAICHDRCPPLKEVGPGHLVACHFSEDRSKA